MDRSKNDGADADQDRRYSPAFYSEDIPKKIQKYKIDEQNHTGIGSLIPERSLEKIKNKRDNEDKRITRIAKFPEWKIAGDDHASGNNEKR
jgi:hypothetical protein